MSFTLFYKKQWHKLIHMNIRNVLPTDISVFWAVHTFDDKRLRQHAQLIERLFLTGEIINTRSGTHALGIPVAALHIVHLRQQQQGFIQVSRL